MNLLALILKQMRQRLLSTSLTFVSVALGVALVIAVLVLHREGRALFGQSDYGYDVILGAKGSPLQLVMNTVYHIDQSPGNIPYTLYKAMESDPRFTPFVKHAIPYAVGDTYMRHRIVATLPRLFGVDDAGQPLPGDVFEYRPGRRYQIVQGRPFHPRKFEAVIGADISERTGLKIGDKFKATHGLPGPNDTPDVHDDQWEVVGILDKTHTAVDRVLFIPLLTFFAVEEHEEELKADSALRAGANPLDVASGAAGGGAAQSDNADDHDHDHHYPIAPDGTIVMDMHEDEWQISAILVRSEDTAAGQQLLYALSKQPDIAAVNPAAVMRQFFDTFLNANAKLLLLIAALVMLVAAFSITATIYNAIIARRRDVAVLRALGATRRAVLRIVCAEAVLIGALGAGVGFILGHLLAIGASAYTQRLLGEPINWASVGINELAYLLLVVVISLCAGLIPGGAAYRTSVADTLGNE